MLTQLVKGQKVKLAELAPGSGALEVGVKIVSGGGEAVDVSCFGLDGNGQLSDDRYFIFYNQKRSPCGGLEMRDARPADGEVFALDLARLPATIKRLVFTAAIDGAGSMAGLRASQWQLSRQGQAVAAFAFEGKDFGTEKALMVAEFYRKDEEWRVAAVGQGFAGGLSALLKHFGGEEAAPGPAASPALPAPPVPPPVPATPPPVRLTKVTLDKVGARQTVNLKKGGGLQPIAVNLKWNQRGADTVSGGGGFLGLGKTRAAANADLDLGCMFLMRDGMKGVVQPIGGNFGSRTQSPFIFLDKDDRSGAASDGENLTIFRPDLIERVLVFAFIYEGAANFSQVNARLTLREQDGSEILIALNNPDSGRGFCGICLIQRVGEGVEVSKEERYFNGHRDADAHFSFGFQWTRGSK